MHLHPFLLQLQLTWFKGGKAQAGSSVCSSPHAGLEDHIHKIVAESIIGAGESRRIGVAVNTVRPVCAFLQAGERAIDDGLRKTVVAYRV